VIILSLRMQSRILSGTILMNEPPTNTILPSYQDPSLYSSASTSDCRNHTLTASHQIWVTRDILSTVRLCSLICWRCSWGNPAKIITWYSETYLLERCGGGLRAVRSWRSIRLLILLLHIIDSICHDFAFVSSLA